MVATPPFRPKTVLRRFRAALPAFPAPSIHSLSLRRLRIGWRTVSTAAWLAPGACLSHAATRTYHFDATVTGTASGNGSVASSSIATGDVLYVEYSFDDTQTDSQASTSQGTFANAALTLEVRRASANAGTWTGAQGGVTIGNRLIQTSTGPGAFSFRPQSLTGGQSVTVTGGTLPGTYTMSAARFDHLVTVNDTGSGQQLGAQVTNPFTPTGHPTTTMTFGPAVVTVSVSNFASGGHPQYAPYLSVGGVASTYTAGSSADSTRLEIGWAFRGKEQPSPAPWAR